MFSKFFIDRPKFAAVLSVVIVMAGALSLQAIPVAQFPNITPPVIQVGASFPGASAEVLEKSVAVPIEEELNGIDDLIYMSSTSSNDGRVSISLTFAVGTDPDIAQVNVQNRIRLAEARLPEDVVRRGVSIDKQSTSVLLFIQFFSPDASYDELFISNYAQLNVHDRLQRINGVGTIQVYGEREYGMRIWLNPDRMASLGLTTTDVANAIREQNIQVAAGTVGQTPSESDQQFRYTIQTQGRLSDPDEFGRIIVRSNQDGSAVRISDIGRVELGAQTYSNFARLNGKPTVVYGVYLQPGGNALQVSEQIRAELAEAKKAFPKGLDWTIVYDTTRFVDASIRELLITLGIATLLVVAVVYVFLGDWRSTAIPLAAIPVSLIGALAAMHLLGYSLNTITLFGLILAVGIVVDDAIVVIENVQRWIGEGLKPREAAIKTMEEVTAPVIATTLVLLAVFVPVGFIPGLTGKLYEQFAVVMSVAVVLSTINALTLSPALAATIARDPGRRLLPLRLFERAFAGITRGYGAVVGSLVRRLALMLVLFGMIAAAGYDGFRKLPSAFFPVEDQGYFFVHIQLPEGSTLHRTEQVMKQVNDILNATPGIANTVQLGGFNLVSGASSANAALTAAVLEPWEKRPSEQYVTRIVGDVSGKLAAIPGALIFPIVPPSVRGLGRVGGFEFQLQDKTARPVQEFAGIVRAFVAKANQQPELRGVFTTFQANVPQIFAEVDRRKVRALGIPLTELYATMQTQLGSFYVNDFNSFGRVYRVLLQAERDYRDNPNDIQRFYVRSQAGRMVPLGTLVRLKPTLGPETVTRYNLLRAARINGGAAPCYSSCDAIAAMERVAAATLPPGMTFEWSGTSLQEIQAGSQTLVILLLALVFVYLFLVAQYESWTVPLAVMLAVPIAATGAVAALHAFGVFNNIYAQIGMVMLIGLASKNAILVVEFALNELKAGKSVIEAAVAAARLRFRAVIMTAISFVLGVVPLVYAVGAGAEGRQSLGTPVFGGMLAGAVIGTLFVPVFFVAVQRLSTRSRGQGGGARRDRDERSNDTASATLGQIAAP
ncbi:MAG: efflux RND transporter permease subunit [Methyloligellaceae bacterium]